MSPAAERKRLIAVGVEGGDAQRIEATGLSWVSCGGNRCVALFGLKGRSEDDAESALRFALSTSGDGRRQSVKEINITISGSELRVDWEMEFAADLRALQNGETLVAPALAGVYDRLFLFEEVEEGGAALFFLRGERRRPERIRGLKAAVSPLIGRESELHRLLDLLEQITFDQGQIVSLTGEAGIGKTRLTAAFKDILRERSIPFVEGHYRIRDDLKLYSAFQQIVSSLVGGTIETLSRWEMSDVETDFLRLFLEPGKKIDRLAQLSEEQIRHGLFSAVRKLIHATARSPLVVIVEDVHWADPASIELISHLIEGMESTHLLLVLVHRPDFKPPWTKRLNYSEIPLTRLGDDELEKFVASALGVQSIAARVRQELTRLSLGNPLFAEEMVRRLLETSHLSVETTEEGEKILRFRTDPPAEIPSTLHSLIAARLDRLAPGAQDLLRWAVLLGPSFDEDELRGVSPATAKYKPSLEELVEKGYFEEQSSFPRKILRFQHDLLFEMIRGSLDESDRRQRQTDLARFLASRVTNDMEELLDRVAEHYLESSDTDAAQQWSMRAAQRNANLFLYPTAERFFRKSVECWRELSSQERPTPDITLEPWIRTLLALGKYDAAENALTEWSMSVGEESPSSRATYFLALAELHRLQHDYSNALEAADQAIEAVDGDSKLNEKRFRAIEHRLTALLHRGRGKTVIHEGLQVLRSLDEGEPLMRFRIWTHMACVAVNGGEIKQADDYLEKANALTRDTLPPADLIAYRICMAEALTARFDFEEALAQVQEGLRVAEESGMRGHEATLLLQRGRIYQEMGNLARAEKDYRDAEKNSQSQGNELGKIRALLHLADWNLERGTTDEAERYLRKIDGALVEQLGLVEAYHRVFLFAECKRRRGDTQEALNLLRTAAGKFHEAGYETLYARVVAKQLALEASAKTRPPAALAADYRELLATLRGSDAPLIFEIARVTALRLEAAGADITPPISKNGAKGPAWLKREINELG